MDGRNTTIPCRSDKKICEIIVDAIMYFILFSGCCRGGNEKIQRRSCVSVLLWIGTRAWRQNSRRDTGARPFTILSWGRFFSREIVRNQYFYIKQVLLGALLGLIHAHKQCLTVDKEAVSLYDQKLKEERKRADDQVCINRNNKIKKSGLKVYF